MSEETLEEQEKQSPEVPKKFLVLGDDFIKAVQQSSPEELDKRLADLTKLIEEQRDLMKKDPAVLDAKEKLKNLLEPYRDDVKENKAKIRLIIEVLKSKGKV